MKIKTYLSISEDLSQYLYNSGIHYLSSVDQKITPKVSEHQRKICRLTIEERV